MRDLEGGLIRREDNYLKLFALKVGEVTTIARRKDGVVLKSARPRIGAELTFEQEPDGYFSFDTLQSHDRAGVSHESAITVNEAGGGRMFENLSAGDRRFFALER